MNIVNLVGVMICLSAFSMSFLLTKNVEMYFNLVALLVVISGTIGSGFLSYSFSRIKSALLVARNAYFASLPSQDDIIKALLEMAVKSRYDGILSLERALDRTHATFLRVAVCHSHEWPDLSGRCHRAWPGFYLAGICFISV